MATPRMYSVLVYKRDTYLKAWFLWSFDTVDEAVHVARGVRDLFQVPAWVEQERQAANTVEIERQARWAASEAARRRGAEQLAADAATEVV